MAYDEMTTHVPRAVLIGNGSRGPYTLNDSGGNPIRVRTHSHLVVRRYSSVTDEVGTALALNTDYTVTNTDVDAVTITLTSAQAVVASTERLVVTRLQSLADVISLSSGGNFSAEALSAAMSVLTEELQETRRDVDRSIKPSWRNTVTPSLPIAPSATKLLGHTSDDTLAHVEVATISPTGVTLGAGWSTVLGLAAPGSLDDLAGIRFVATYAALTALVAATGLADNAVYYTYGRTAEEDGGAGFWRYDSGSSATANGGTILAIDGGGAGRFFRLFDPAKPVNAQWFGFKVGGGNSDATANTTALQAALDANYWVQLPEGTAYINTITHTRSNRVTGAGQAATVLVRSNSLNNNGFYASGKNDLIYEDLTLDGNRTNNTGSGSHGGVRLEGGCLRWRLRRVKATGWRGLFSGFPVGAGMSSIDAGSGGELEDCWFTDCYDGYVLSAHTDARDFGSRFTANTRNGGLVAAFSDRFESHGVYAFGNCTTYAGAGLQIIDTNDAKTYGGTFNSSTLGHGLQHNGSDRCEVHGGTYNSNGISGLDFYDSIDGKVFGGYAASNAIRGLEIDSASNGCVVTGFQGVSNGDVDISVFRSADIQLIGCEGNVRGWDAANIASATVSAGGTGYAVGNVLTITGGTKGTAATLTVATLSGSAVATVTVSNAGDYWTFPTEPCAVTGGAGTGATFNFVATGEASSTCPRLQIMGGHRSDTILLVADACTDVRLTDVKATTITDVSSEIVSAVGCANVSIPIKTASLQNSWVVDTRAVYYKDADGIVHIEGRIKSGTVAGNTLIFTLDAGYRPANTEYFLLGVSGATGLVYIGTDGTVRDLGGTLNATWSSLNGIKFRAA